MWLSVLSPISAAAGGCSEKSGLNLPHQLSQEGHVSTVQIKCTALLLLVLGLLHRYFPLLCFQPTQAAGIFVCLIFFFLTVIPYLKTVFTSVPVGIGFMTMASVALLFHVKPRSWLSVNPELKLPNTQHKTHAPLPGSVGPVLVSYKGRINILQWLWAGRGWSCVDMATKLGNTIPTPGQTLQGGRK